MYNTKEEQDSLVKELVDEIKCSLVVTEVKHDIDGRGLHINLEYGITSSNIEEVIWNTIQKMDKPP